MYFYIALISICSFLFVYNQSLKKDIEFLNYQIDNYSQQMLMIEKETKAYENKVLSSFKSASIELKNDVVEAGLILDEKVSSECDKAMDWGIKRALAL